MIAESMAMNFQVPGQLVALEAIGSGNVNDTYRVVLRTTFSEEQYILQRINRSVFKNPALVMANMKAVTDHAHKRILAEAEHADRIWQLPRVIPAINGNDFMIDEEGEYWRALSMIASTTSCDKISTPEHATEAGRVLGHFQSIISDFPIDQLEDTLPGFHITPEYLKKYDQVLTTADAQARLSLSAEASRLAKFVEDRRDFVHVLESARERGEIHLRPIHGDPKITNVMIDEVTGKGTSIVDLDTVKPGLIHYDFGDAVRSGCNPAGEEATDLKEVMLDLDLFQALVQGYLFEAKSFLTDNDKKYLYDSVRLIAFELGLRFFKDYLIGNVYFKTSYEAQNLNRARVQFALCESIERRESQMRAILEEHFVEVAAVV
jgi:Ser/Thr protein kinase RdoA (MazF antagonist)